MAAVAVGAKKSCKARVYADGCDEKRSCRDCLNAADDDGLECYLDALAGTCNAFSELSPTALAATAGGSSQNASERLQLLATDYQVFASTRQRYCSVNDGACTLCQTMADLKGYAPSNNQLKRMTSDRNVCYGSNNCICVAKCEGRSWLSNAGKRCSSASSLPSYNQPSASSDNTRSTMLTFMGVFAAQLVVLLVLLIRKKRAIDRRREANGPYHTAGVVSDENRLQLPGWMAWQRELRDQEKRETPYVNLHKLQPSSSRHTLETTASEASISSQPPASPQSGRDGGGDRLAS
jgi:hypothetical protein